MKKSVIFAVRSEVCCEIESTLNWTLNDAEQAKQYLQNSEEHDTEYWSAQLERAQYKVKIFKELLDKIDSIKAD